MTQAIGSATSGTIAAVVATSGAAAAALESQLSRYQKQLSECVNCESSKTAEGKAQIQDIFTRIAEIKERIDKVAEVTPGDRSNGLATSTAIETNASKNAGEPKTASASKSAPATIGSILDVTA